MHLTSDKLAFVWIEWVDSTRAFGWREPDQHPNLEAISIGILISESDECVTISSSTCGEMFLDHLTIPRCAITKLQHIEWVG